MPCSASARADAPRVRRVIRRHHARAPACQSRDGRNLTMPLDLCHPETPHKKLRIPEWYVSSLMMDRALDAVVRRAKKIDRKHDIPYLAGYGIDGKTIYIDRHMPQTMRYAGRDLDTDRYLILHEE